MVPHRIRLIVVAVGLALNAAAIAAIHYGLDEELAASLRPLLEGLILVLLGLGTGDAALIELRRRNPRIPALHDDVREGREEREP